MKLLFKCKFLVAKGKIYNCMSQRGLCGVKFGLHERIGIETGNELATSIQTKEYRENCNISAHTNTRHITTKGTTKNVIHCKFRSQALLSRKKNYSLALSLCLIHSFSPSFLSVFHQPAGGCKMRMGSTSPHLPNKRLKKRERERGADGGQREKE